MCTYPSLQRTQPQTLPALVDLKTARRPEWQGRASPQRRIDDVIMELRRLASYLWNLVQKSLVYEPAIVLYVVSVTWTYTHTYACACAYTSPTQCYSYASVLHLE